MQTVDIRSRFEATGVVRLQGAFAAEQAAAMQEAVWRHAERQAGLRPGDPASWASSPTLNWQGLKRNPAFRPLADNQPDWYCSPADAWQGDLPGRRYLKRVVPGLRAPGAGIAVHRARHHGVQALRRAELLSIVAGG